MLRRTVARFLLLLLAAFLFNSSVFAAVPNLPLSRLSPEDEGLNAEIILSRGKRMAEGRAFLVEANRLSRQSLLSKRERVTLFAEMVARQQPRTEAIAPLGQFGNSFDRKYTAHGAILLGWSGANPAAWCAWLTISGYCHAGLFDRTRYTGSANDYAIRTANRDIGAKYERPEYWQGFQEVREMRVNGLTAAQLDSAVAHAAQFHGPFSIFTSKAANDSWYCSKILWRAFADTLGIDLDVDGGYLVFPGDIRWDIHTSTVRSWQ